MISRILQQFPNLAIDGFRITSPATISYNCIAWAANDTTKFWWPDAHKLYFWPMGAPRKESLEAFIKAYGLLRYMPCISSDIEEGFEKIALFIDSAGKPTHAARQLPSGKWTSKLGPQHDIEHNSLDGLEGINYGRVGQVLQRPNAASDTSK